MKDSSDATRSLLTAVAVTTLILSSTFVHGQSKDAPGCKDSPYLSRFPGTVIMNCEDKGDDSYEFVVADGKKCARRVVGNMPRRDSGLTSWRMGAFIWRRAANVLGITNCPAS